MEEIMRYFSLKSVISAVTPCHPTNLFVGLSVCLIGCLFVRFRLLSMMMLLKSTKVPLTGQYTRSSAAGKKLFI